MKILNSKTSSYLIIFTILLFSWLSAQHISHSYDYVMFLRLTFGLLGLFYLLVQFRYKPKLPRSRVDIALVILTLFWIFQYSSAPNQAVAFPRLLLFFTYLLFFYLIWDALDRVLDQFSVLPALLWASSFFILTTLWEVYSAYREWWQVFGINGQSPITPYRFHSVIGHSNILTAFLNLLAPIAIILFFQTKSKLAKAGLALWLVGYLACILLASSRGGLLGAATAVGFVILFNLKKFPVIRNFSEFTAKTRILIIIACILLIAIAGLVAYQYLVSISSHPTHGGDQSGLNLNRDSIWGGYINVFRTSPLLGSGLGYHPIEFQNIADVFPAGWWPLHAHNTPLSILAESGIIGISIIIVLLTSGAITIFRIFKKLEGRKKALASGLISGLLAIGAQAIFEDFLVWPMIIIPSLIYFAWLLSQEKPVPRHTKIPLILLAIPILILMTSGIIQAQQHKVLTSALDYVNQEEWEQAAETILSNRVAFIQSPYLSTQAAYILANASGNTDKLQYLQESDQFFSASITFEPGISMNIASKAAVSWQLGDRDLAIEEITRAIELSPDEPSYPLNLAWFHEQIGNDKLSEQMYIQALELSKNRGWIFLPFWQQTPIRSQAAAAFSENNPDLTPPNRYTRAGIQHFNVGQISDAKKQLLIAEWEGETSIGTQFLEGLLLMQDGKNPEAIRTFQSVYQSGTVVKRQLNRIYSQSYYMNSIDIDFVPGYIHLFQDFGQVKYSEDIFSLILSNSGCQAAQEMWENYSIFIHGGQRVEVPTRCP